MPSTVNRWCFVYILVRHERSQTISLKFRSILLSKVYTMRKQYQKSTMISQFMKSLYAHDVIDVLPLSWFWLFGKKLVPKARCEAFWNVDITNCNLSKIGSKNNALRFCEIWIRTLKACNRIETGRRWKMKTPKFSWIVMIFAWRLLDIFEKCSENEN